MHLLGGWGLIAALDQAIRQVSVGLNHEYGQLQQDEKTCSNQDMQHPSCQCALQPGLVLFETKSEEETKYS